MGKNWKQEKPKIWNLFWYRKNKDTDPILGIVLPVHNIFQFGENIINIDDMDGWWALAKPPEWDGE